MSAAERFPFLDERSAALVTSAVSLRYLCGEDTAGAIALISREESFLFVGEGVEVKKSAGFSVIKLSDFKQILDILVKFAIKKIYIETDKVTVAELAFFKETLHYAEIVESDELSAALMRLRTIKTEAETACVKKAQTVCDRAYQRLLGTIRKGMTERQIAASLGYYLAEFGADEQAFPAIALSGENAALPNARSGSRKLCEGDLLVLEFGARVNGYCAKMARTVAVGEISPKAEDVYNAVSCAVFDGLKTLRAGIGAKVADSVARATLNAWNVDKYAEGDFTRGIGLEVSEPPFGGEKSSALFKAGMTISAGMGIMIPGRLGVKITDCCALTSDGCVNFTAATRELVHI